MENEKTGYSSIDKPWMKQYKFYDETKDNNYITDKTVWEVTESLLEKHSAINFIEYFGRNISRETFAGYVEMWARAFRAMGIDKGDLIPIYTPATPEAFAMFFATNAIGAIPYYQKLAITKEALEEETKGAEFAVVFDSLWENVKNVFGQERFKNVFVLSAADSMMFPLKWLTKFKSIIERSENAVPKTDKFISADQAKNLARYYTGEYKVPFEKDRIAAITTSSGTTSSVVKGIMDTNESMLASLACTINAETGYAEGKRTLTCFPPTASTSINCLQLLPTFTGGTIIFDPRVDISIWYDQVIKYKPDITISTGPLWERFVQNLLKKENETGKVQNLSWQDYFIMGGAGTTRNILNYLNSVVRERGAQRDFSVGYGFSEVFGVLSVTKYNGNYKEVNNDKQVISVGIPLPGYTVGIFDEQGNELPYGTGLRGELWIKAPSNMEGYFNKPEVTALTIIDGWIHSGDLCEIDNDGNIYCYGRLKNHININHRKTYLFDIANDIRDHFKLHDVIVEKKKLVDGSTSLDMYFVQETERIIENKELILKMDRYLEEKNIVIDGYKEFVNSLPIDPTTLKPKSRDTEGFIKYKGNEKYDVSYAETISDIYQKKESNVVTQNTITRRETMKKFNEFLKQYQPLVTLAGVIATIAGLFICTTTISNSINTNFSNVNTNEINVNGVTEESVEQQFYEAQIYYRAGDYGNAMRMYQGIQNDNAAAKSNIGYLYAHGLGVEQSTQAASEYYRAAYEMGYEQALQNYISINLTAPYGYAKTLEALKYGYHQNDETAIRYLATAFYGQMPDLTMGELREIADKFMDFDEDTQLAKLKTTLHFTSSEIVLFVDDNPPKDTDFVRYVKSKGTVLKREIQSYNPITEPGTNETFIFPIHTTAEMDVYMKESYSFYMGDYCPLDKFGEW